LKKGPGGAPSSIQGRIRIQQTGARAVVTIVGTTEQYLFTGGFFRRPGTVFFPRWRLTADGRCVSSVPCSPPNLFPRESPLGEKNQNLTSNVLSHRHPRNSRALFLDSSIDNQAIIPMPEMISGYKNTHELDQIQVKWRPWPTWTRRGTNCTA